MDLFTPVVPEERQHQHFRALLSAADQDARDVLRRWADGFADRDGKFVIEFQTTFNSSFWELYLNAAFGALGLVRDYAHASPDYACSGNGADFTAEAAIASHADGYAAEWEARPDDEITPERRQAMLEYASIRLANAFDGKLQSFRQRYSRLPHVAGKPFVVCLAPFEQPQAFALADRPLRRVLYASDVPIYRDIDEEGVRVVLGDTVAERVWKASDAEIAFGMFTDDRAREVSAVFYSNVATFGKVQVLAAPSSTRQTTAFAVRYNDAGLRPHFIEATGPDYEESLLDGLHVFLNPHAQHPLDPHLFLGREVAVHYGFDASIEQVRSDVPDGFLFSRMTHTISARGIDAGRGRRPASPPIRGRMPAVVPWPEGDLRYVGGHAGMFTDNHLAHYKGWTILVARDANDGEWAGSANRGIYRDLASWVEAHGDDAVPAIPVDFGATRDEAFEALKREVDGREGVSAG